MKYPQSVAMPRDVEDWLEGELEARGIDAVVYTRYVLSLMQQDSLDFDVNDAWPRLPQPKFQEVWSGHKRERKELGKLRTWDQEALKRLAVVRCLMSATGQKCEIESLVDELCAKLKDIQHGAADEEPAFRNHSETPPYADYNKAFPPLQDYSEHSGRCDSSFASSAWTGGILRASLDKTETALPYDDTLYAQHCFPLMYCGPRNMYGNGVASAPTRDDVKPLYERSGNTYLDRVIARLDSTIQEIWNPDYAPAVNHPASFALNQGFYNSHKLFSPTLFAYGHVDEPIAPPLTAWSLGGAATTLPYQRQAASCLKVATPRETVEECSVDIPGPPASLAEEEDLLTSARTHFRPIRSDELGPATYADGTTFAISTELVPLQFQRSESGTLFLEAGKYMEYKKEQDGELGSEEFVPKFRVQQCNEKFCQTEDVGVMAEMPEQVVPESPVSSVSDPDEFFFPGDDELALDLNVGGDLLPAEDEVVQIVSGRLDVRWKAPEATPPAGPGGKVDHSSESEHNWEAKDAALVDELVDEDSNWGNAAACPLDAVVDDDADDEMEGVDGEEDQPDAPYLPHLTDSIWNPNNDAQVCESCKRDPAGVDELSANTFMAKHEWQEIWGQPVCNGCKDDIPRGAAQELWEACGVKTAPNPWKDTSHEMMGVESNDRDREFPFPDLWKAGLGFAPGVVQDQEQAAAEGWKDFGPIGNEAVNLNKWDNKSPGWEWPKMSAALSAYLEESRVRACEMLNVWSPVLLPTGDTARKPSDVGLRNLWSPACEDPGPRMLPAECRVSWSPVADPFVDSDAPCARPLTYCLLRDELSEDGDQLLSDLSCLHLQQLGSTDGTEASDLQELDQLTSVPPSPDSDKGHRLVSVWGTWNLIEVIGENLPTLFERPYSSETAQKERKRRHSSSQKVCELYREGECRRPHCRFMHDEDAAACVPSSPLPLSTDADAPCFTPHTFRFARELQRAFTL